MPRAQSGTQRVSFDQTQSFRVSASVSRQRRASRGTRALLRAVAISLPVLALLLAVTAPAAAHEGAGRPLDRRIAPRILPGAVLSDHGISVTVPEPGGFVWGELKFPDGTWEELGVETSAQGRVTVIGDGSERAAVLKDRYEVAARGTDAARLGAEIASSTASSRRNAECRDTFRNLYWWRTPDLEWRFNPSGTPDYLRDDDGGTVAVEDALVRAQGNITASTNRCGRGDRVKALGALVGTTTRLPNVTRGGSCTGGDGRSVIQFGDLPSYSVAMTCVYGIRKGVAVEADIRINSVETRWAVDRTTCSGKELLIEAALTHEFGHVYGLAHASTYRDPWLTMQPLIRACSSGPSTLGLGDMLGLEKKY